MTEHTTDTEQTDDEPAPDFIGDDHPGQTHVVDDEDLREERDVAFRTTIEEKRDPLADDFAIGDPAIDLANGRAVTVVGTPEQTVAEWSGDNGYDLIEDNYANERLRARPNDPVIEAVYTTSIQSEPSGPRGSEGPYTFPSSRLARVTIESVEGVRRVYDLVAVDVLKRLFKGVTHARKDAGPSDVLNVAALEGGFGAEAIKEAYELADVELREAASGEGESQWGATRLSRRQDDA